MQETWMEIVTLSKVILYSPYLLNDVRKLFEKISV